MTSDGATSPTCRKTIECLQHENIRLARELARAQQENDDLVKSAEIWIRLYESHLTGHGPAAHAVRL